MTNQLEGRLARGVVDEETVALSETMSQYADELKATANRSIKLSRAEAYRLRGSLSSKLKQPEKAKGSFGQAREIIVTLPASNISAETCEGLGKVYVSMALDSLAQSDREAAIQNFDEAIKQFELACQKAPQSQRLAKDLAKLKQQRTEL